MATWISQPELVEIVGAEAARMLMHSRGGIDFYVPHPPATPTAGSTPMQQGLMKIMDERAALALCREFGGQYVCVPNGKKPEPHKAKIVEALQRGEAPKKIALQMGVTERYVWFVSANVKPAVTQRTLPF